MIAEVYPIARLPRRFGVFDYLIPDGMELRRGDTVRVPFRGFERLGIVANVKAEAAVAKVRPIVAKVDGWRLAAEEVGMYETLAAELCQSVGAMLHASLPVAAKRGSPSAPRPSRGIPLTIPADEAASVGDTASKALGEPRAFVFASDLRRACAIVSRLLAGRNGATLVLCPNSHDARLAAAALHTHKPIVLDGDETAGSRHAAYMAFRNDSKALLVTTRLGALFGHPKLERIFVLRSGHENHKQADRNPRYDARRVASMLADKYDAGLTFLDVSPRADDLFALKPFGSAPATETTLVSLAEEVAGKSHKQISLTVESRVAEALEAEKRVLLAYNRKTAKYKFGNRAVAVTVENLFPGVKAEICDRDSAPPSRDAQVVVATSHYLENLFDPFRPDGFGLVVLLDADAPLIDAGFRATENAFRRLEEWRGVAHACRAPFLVQTKTPDLFRPYLADPVAAMRQELENRRAYGFPPFGRLIRLRVRGDGERAFAAVVDELKAAGIEVGREEPGKAFAIVPEAKAAEGLAILCRAPDAVVIDSDAIS
jgi:primosomal protein N'